MSTVVPAIMATLTPLDPADVVAWHVAQDRRARQTSALRRKLAAVRTRSMVRGA